MIKGIFIKEYKNRFICLVEIDGIKTECYVSSSSKLGKYINLERKPVLLSENKGKNLRTKYTLQAVKTHGRWILLNLNCINDLCLEAFCKENKSMRNNILREKFIDEYKADFYYATDKLIIEAKGILAEGEAAVYPLVSCGRTLRQLNSIKDKLIQGYKVEYVFVLMNTKINNIILNSKQPTIVKAFSECIGLGLKITCYIAKYKNYKWQLEKTTNKLLK